MENLEAKTIVEWIYKNGYTPDEWESKFIDSILSQEYKLSSKQNKCLTRIYEKSSGGSIYQERERI